MVDRQVKLERGEANREGEADYVSRSAYMIEAVLEAFGLITKVVEVEIQKQSYVFYLEVAVGTNLKTLEKHSRDLALALASPTGKVRWQIPVPGRALVGLYVPRLSQTALDRFNQIRRQPSTQSLVRNKLSSAFSVMGKVCNSLATELAN